MSEVKYKICPKCGEEMLRVPDGKICPHCGTEILDDFSDVVIFPPPEMTLEEALKKQNEYIDWDWEKFRREAAKDILCAIIDASIPIEHQIPAAVKYADTLIAKLKGDGKD